MQFILIHALAVAYHLWLPGLPGAPQFILLNEIWPATDWPDAAPSWAFRNLWLPPTKSDTELARAPVWGSGGPEIPRRGYADTANRGRIGRLSIPSSFGHIARDCRWSVAAYRLPGLIRGFEQPEPDCLRNRQPELWNRSPRHDQDVDGYDGEPHRVPGHDQCDPRSNLRISDHRRYSADSVGGGTECSLQCYVSARRSRRPNHRSLICWADRDLRLPSHHRCRSPDRKALPQSAPDRLWKYSSWIQPNQGRNAYQQRWN